ncbi:histidine decarboxylase [Sitophilus oryzae]|uniref:Histidine decarboxylase n=1 Tax=Sitophilus oryzae TaxID=7048 RepID=A0A6J2YND7_SITOR|nr:histidine decarboxylase [Sitophilus oryzae]
MDSEEFRTKGKEVIDYIADYLENIRERRVFPDKKPGFIRELIPDSAPLKGESWDNIFKDLEKVIMPGVTHWQSPHMHAYFPALTSYPSMLGEMISNAINCIGFTWASSPACTELEMIVMNWLGKMIGLPEEFLHRKNGDGGGVIQTTASECTLISLLAGRYVAIKMYEELYPDVTKHEINGKLVAYCSDQAHSSVEKAALIGLVTLRYIDCDENYSMRGSKLLKAIKQDREQGLIPFWVCATLGTTGACAFDNLEEITEVCYNELLWCHVDAAYAGSAFTCPEYRIWLKGIDKANSIAFNPSKWLMVHFDCTAMWVKNSSALHGAFNVNPLYLTHEYSGLAIDYMHWQIPLSKRFRALKLWFVIRNYGITGIQEHIRKGVHMAEKFELFVRNDPRFEIPAKRHLGLVVFRLVGDNFITETLCKRLNSRGNIHCVPANLKGKYVIRFTVTSPRTTLEDIITDWKEIVGVANIILQERDKYMRKTKVPLGETRDKNENFGSSLLLSNVPMSPKIVNGSFAAIYDQGDVLEQFSKTIKLRKDAQDSPAMRRRIKGILMSGKQFSLDSRLDLFHGIETSPTLKTPLENLPVLEDSSETEDKSNSTSDNDSSPNATNKDNLAIPSKRHSRSKSVDHQTDISINNCMQVKDVCHKCGHAVAKLPKKTSFDIKK